MPSLGIKLSPQNCAIDDLRAVWRIADEAGFDHLWAFDHFNPILSDVAGDVFEGMTLLSAMAEATSRVRIGLMVAGNTYRHPGVMAKMATTIDHLSGGRLEFGLGASAAEVEHTMLGIPFYTAGERIRRLGEALTVCRMLWTEERASFEGRYYRLTDAISNPKPLQRPHPPIWVGGAGEKLTLRVVAEHADYGTSSARSSRWCARLMSSISTAPTSVATPWRSSARCSRASTPPSPPRWSTRCTPTSKLGSLRTSSASPPLVSRSGRQKSPPSESSRRSLVGVSKAARRAQRPIARPSTWRAPRARLPR
jgi:hypothetical protein